MAEFKVNTDKIKNSAGEISRIAGMMGGYPENIRRIAGNLKLGSTGGYGIKGQLQSLADTVNDQVKHTVKLGTALLEISQQYQSTEKHITDGKTIAHMIIPERLEPLKYGAASDKKKTDEAKQKKTSVSWLSGKYAGSGKVLGFNSQGEASGELFGASYKNKFTTGIKWKEKDGKKVLDSVSVISATVAGEAHVAKGAAKGNIGYLRGNVEGTVGEVGATGSVNASVVKGGKFAPQVSAKAEASAVGAKGNAEGGIGTENNNIHAGLDGKAGVAKASAEVSAGTVYVKNKDGSESKHYGVKAEAGAEAYIAEGKVSGGVTILGVKINAGLGGKVGGAGAKAGGSVTTGGVSGSASVGFVAGLEVDLSIDWSGFKWKW